MIILTCLVKAVKFIYLTAFKQYGAMQALMKTLIPVMNKRPGGFE